MFTGLIESVGSIVSVEKREGSQRIAISSPEIAAKLHTGDSVAVSGVCLTALDIERTRLPRRPGRRDRRAHFAYRRSSPGSKVNLELPTPAGTPLGGHVVQGHVDGTGTLLSLTPVDPSADP